MVLFPTPTCQVNYWRQKVMFRYGKNYTYPNLNICIILDVLFWPPDGKMRNNVMLIIYAKVRLEYEIFFI